MAGLGSERQPATWRGLPAWRVASNELWAVVCPERGGKIASLFDVRTGREWLVPAPLRPLRPLTYGSLWSAYEMAGWDEVFPTLGECAHPGPGRATGVRLPDHGEVWALPWTDETPADGAEVVCSVAGAALPYRLRRTLSVDGPALRLDYELANDGVDPLPCQWLAHPLIGVRPDTELLVAGDVDLSGRGLRFAPMDTTVASAIAVDRDSGAWLRLDWDPVDVRWFAFVADDGGLNPNPNVVLSPATGWGPDLRTAAGAQAAMTVPPGGAARWSLRATVGATSTGAGAGATTP